MHFSLVLVRLFVNPISPGGRGGGTKCPQPFNIAISRKRVFLLFDFYYFGVRQFLMKKTSNFFTPPPSEGGTKKMKKIENWS